MRNHICSVRYFLWGWTYFLTMNRPMIWIIHVISGGFGYKIRVKGKENLPESAFVMAVADHFSLKDAWTIAWIYGLSRPIHWFVAMKLLDIPRMWAEYRDSDFKDNRYRYLLAPIAAILTKVVVGHGLTIPVCNEGKVSRTSREINIEAVRLSVSLLMEGRIVAVFPQGGFDGSKVGSGFINIAKRADVPIVPVRLGRDGTIIIGRPVPHADLSCNRESAVGFIEKYIKPL